MTQERADEIIRKVFYSNFHIFPTRCEAEESYFHIGRMVGEMQKTLEIELAKENGFYIEVSLLLLFVEY